jgi:phospholipase/carboxylesterase
MKNLSLHSIIREPKKKIEDPPLLILLHGYGSNEDDLFSFSNELPDELLIVSARGPMTLGIGSYAWYSINFNNDQGKFSDTDEAKKAREIVANFIGEIQIKYNISSKNTFLLGFSQGTVLAYAIALNYPEKVQQIIALSGYINPDLLPNDFGSKDYSKLHIFISHGSLDQVIPVQWAQKAPEFLKSLNIENSYQEYPVGHGVTPQNFYDFKKWIENRI